MGGNNRHALWLTVYYTAFTWIPTVVLVLLPNDWYYLILKALAGFWLLGGITNFIRHQSLIMMIGSSGAGFVLNTVWFGALLFWPPYWARAILGFLIVTTLFTCYNIIRKMQVDPMSELEQIANNNRD